MLWIIQKPLEAYNLNNKNKNKKAFQNKHKPCCVSYANCMSP